MGIESIFLAYANNSLRDSIENSLIIIFNEIARYPNEWYDPNTRDLKIACSVASLISTLSDFSSSIEISSFKENLHKQIGNEHEFFKGSVESAIEACYGSHGGYFEGECHLRPYRQKLFGEDHFLGTKRLKCYECEQLAFVNILAELIEGKEFSDIFGFDQYLKPVHSFLEIVPSNSQKLPFREALQETTFWGAEIFFLPGKPRFAFNEFLKAFVSRSLSEFLLKNDRRKIKRCKECNEFYISKSIRESLFCSDKCKNSFHNREAVKLGTLNEYKRKKRAEGTGTLSYYG